MKGGSCKTAFVQWEDCVDKAKEADGDFVEKCAKQTEALRDCMMADPGYYGDMLPDEEKAGGPEDGDAKEDPSSEERKDDPSTRSDEPPRAPAAVPPGPQVKESRAAAAVRR
jgi:intermembrane space import and assembly protein 40